MERSNTPVLRRFFLGPMAEEERASLEDRLLDDEEFYREALVVEDEIADELVDGSLGPAERTAFLALVERSPALRERMDHAAALHAVLRRSTEAAPRPGLWARAARVFAWPTAAWRPALAGGLAAALAVGVWSQVQMAGLRSDLAAVGAQRDQARSQQAQAREALEQQRQEHERRLEAARAGAPPLATFALSGGTRSESGPLTLRVPSGPGSVVLQLEADAPGELRALLRTVRGEQVLVRAGLRAGSAGGLMRVDVPVPAELLTKGSYEIVLESRRPGGSWEMIGIYSFEVVRPR